jgi:hypothetical protein
MIKKRLELLESNDQESQLKTKLSINKNYADKYENWRSKEELQKRNGSFLYFIFFNLWQNSLRINDVNK